ncbi:MAG: hypothetical protein KQA41_03095 [Candidatus Aenigmarchaeota archaeon]|nr:hypothetical protein [Candidatus Aenigmarchaeota archaeon]
MNQIYATILSLNQYLNQYLSNPNQGNSCVCELDSWYKVLLVAGLFGLSIYGIYRTWKNSKDKGDNDDGTIGYF